MLLRPVRTVAAAVHEIILFDGYSPEPLAVLLRDVLERVPAGDRSAIIWTADVDEEGWTTFDAGLRGQTLVELLERPAGWVRRPYDNLAATMPPEAVPFLAGILDQVPWEDRCSIRWSIAIEDPDAVRVRVTWAGGYVAA